MTDKQAIETAKSLYEFCKNQHSCQNCVFRKYAPDTWGCNLQAFDFPEIIRNYEAKKKNHGYI